MKSPYAIPFLLLLMVLLPLAASGSLTATETAYSWDNVSFSVPLEIKDNSGVAREQWPVTSGIPLPYGLVKDTSELRLVNENGREIPCQFRVLSRYWTRDHSIRWVLLHFQVDLPANGKRTVRLQNSPPQAPITRPLKITEENGKILVDTGPLQATIPKEGNALLEKVSLYGRTLLEDPATATPFLHSAAVNYAQRFWGDEWNTHGWEKEREVEEVEVPEALQHAQLESVTVEEAGPLHGVVAIRGHFVPPPDIRFPNSLRWNFTIRLHFYRGKSYLQVVYAIENSSGQRPQWVMPFIETGMSLSLAEPAGEATFGYLRGKNAHLALETGLLLPDQQAEARQQPGVSADRKHKRKSQPARVELRLPEVQQPHPVEGRLSFADLNGKKGGLMVTLRYFPEKAPRAVLLSPGSIKLLTHARRTPAKPHWELDLAGRTISEALLLFHDPTLPAQRMMETAEAFRYPLFARAPVAWYAHTEAWYFDIAPPHKTDRKLLRDDHWPVPPNFFRLPPAKPNFNSGGHHESLNSGWLGYLLHGGLRELERNLALSKRAITYPGWAYRDNVMSFGKGRNRYRKLDHALERWDELTAFGPKDFYLWLQDPDGDPEKGWRGRTYLNQYKWLPDHEHYAYFRLFEYYYLTGDRFALDAIHGLVDWDLNFQERHLFKEEYRPLGVVDLFEEDPEALRRGHYSRVYTWMLYTNLAGFEATGNEVMGQFAAWQIRRMLGLLRHRHGQLTSWRPKPAKILGLLPDDLAQRIAGHIDSSLLRSNDEIQESGTQTWMEAQGVLALHEAYRFYQDERILDGIWGLADYFSHHVLFFPKLGMINQWTYMPSPLLGGKKWGKPTIQPQRHDRVVQAFPLLYHYTGWPDVKKRYDAIERARKKSWVRPWFLQTGYWERKIVPKGSDQPPTRITDLKVVKADRRGIILTWTAPRDDGPTGSADRYFIKYSRKPIVEFAPTDNPARDPAKRALVRQVDRVVDRFPSGGSTLTQKQRRWLQSHPVFEQFDGPLASPDWSRVNAFWMAEHVAGEPIPAPAGTSERFTITKLRPHDWFGLNKDPGLEILESGTWYIAVCSWDEDHNLSRLSNVVKVDLP